MRLSLALLLAVLSLTTVVASTSDLEWKSPVIANEMVGPVIVSEYDTRQYRIVTLENKLNVLLISDKDAEKVRKFEFHCL